MKKQIIHSRQGTTRTSGNSWITDIYDVIEETENSYKTILVSTNVINGGDPIGKEVEITKRRIAWNYEMRVVEQ
jgi:hypothetical protein